MKKDMEYNTGQEFEPLPDEYLQGGGNVTSEEKGRKAVWKKMMYMTATLAVMAYTAVGAYASNASVLPQTEKPTVAADELDNRDEPGNRTQGQQPEEQQPEEQHSTGQEQPAETREEQAGNAEPEALPYYPAEDVTSFLTVYNDSFDPEIFDYRILMQDFVFESLLLQGYEYSMPAYEPVDGYLFMGWVVYYDKTAASGPLMGMLGDALTRDNICYVKPEAGSGSSRDIEVHAAWRYDGISEYPYLLVLDANGGTIENESSMTYDAKGPLESESYAYLCAYPTPVREGYTFTGWYTEADGGDKKTRLFGMDFYEKNGDEYDWHHTKTITLYAGWVKN